MEASESTQSVFSEEAIQLKQFLLDFETEQDTQEILKEVEKYIFSPENKWRLKTDDISRFIFTQAASCSEILSQKDSSITVSRLSMDAITSVVSFWRR
jgi:hypothetical protein